MKKYSVIYCDCPWNYGSNGARGGKFGKLDYKTISTADLCKMNVNDISEKDCALYMWTTGAFIPDALEVGKAWGFKFIRIDKVWIKKKESGKPHAVCGPWGLSDCEFIILFVRGTMCSKQIGKRNQYVATEQTYTGKHSRKPDFFRDQINAKYPPELKRLEMFARITPEGWDVFGNEVKHSIGIGWVNN